MKRRLKKFTSLLLTALLAIAAVLPLFPSVSAETAYAVIITASDFQSGSFAAFTSMTAFLKKAKSDGIGTPDGVIFGGDYSIGMDIDAKAGTNYAKNALLSVYPHTDTDRITYIQGNHDLMSAEISFTGLHDMGSYYVYVLNEDSFPSGQKSSLTAKSTVSRLASGMKADLEGIVKSGKVKPVFVAAHIPLHHSRRLQYGDNLYSKYIFDVLNSYGKKLDIIFLFGHNHTSDFDDYIGGSLNFLTKGSIIRIPIPDTASQGEKGYTTEKLNFTYMNYGYVGDVYNTNVKTKAVSVFQLFNDKIKIVRYGENGVCGTNTVTRINKLDSERRLKAAGTAKIDFGSNIITGVSGNSKSLSTFVKVTKTGFTLKCANIRTGSTVQVIKGGTVYEQYTLAVAGDVNGDGKYNSTDALAVLQDSVGQAFLCGAYFAAADADRNGAVNSSDALRILQYSVEMIKEI